VSRFTEVHRLLGNSYIGSRTEENGEWFQADIIVQRIPVVVTCSFRKDS